MPCDAVWVDREAERERAAQRALDALAESMTTGAVVITRDATGLPELNGFDASEFGFSDACVLAFADEHAPLELRMELEAQGVDLSAASLAHAAAHAAGGSH